MTHERTEKPLDCRTFAENLYHFQADELPEADREAFCEHIDRCPPCARRLEVEDALLGSIKDRLRLQAAPAELKSRVRQALEREAPAPGGTGRLRSPWILPLAASLLLAAVLFPLFDGVDPGPGPGRLIRIQGEVVTVVDLPCEKAGKTLAQQRRCTHPDHLNALRAGPGRYWQISMEDASPGRRIVIDEEMRGHQLRVSGDLFAGIQTIQLRDLEDLGLGGITAAALGKKFH